MFENGSSLFFENIQHGTDHASISFDIIVDLLTVLCSITKYCFWWCFFRKTKCNEFILNNNNLIKTKPNNGKCLRP